MVSLLEFDPKVCVLVLNWNGWEDTIKSINSTIESSYKNFFLVVCDNNSSDCSVEKIKSWARAQSVESNHTDETHRFSLPSGEENRLIELFLIENSENLGFSGGCNVGTSFALKNEADYVFFLNNDAIITDGTIKSLVNASIESQASIAGAQIYNSSGSELLYSGLRWPHELFAIYIRPQPNTNEVFWETDGVNGCACLVRKDILELRQTECGYFFDPDFFLYCEETDLCLYNKYNGYKSIIVRDAKCFHEVSKSSGGHGSPLSYYYYTRNRIFLAKRWTNKLFVYLFNFYYLCSRLIIVLSKLRKNSSRDSGFAIAKGLRDGYLGVKGKCSYFSK